MEEELASANSLVLCSDEICANFHNKEERKRLIYERHLRTAFGITSNGMCIIVVV